jgi:hypothetical protein
VGFTVPGKPIPGLPYIQDIYSSDKASSKAIPRNLAG